MMSTTLSTMVLNLARKRYPSVLAERRTWQGPGDIDYAAAWREAVETVGLKFGLAESDLEVVWVGLTEAPAPANAHWGQ